MTNLFVYFFLFVLLHINHIKSQSEEYNECISQQKIANSSSDCISVKIPEKDGFTCCSMKITMGEKLSYQCFPLENRYINPNLSKYREINEYKLISYQQIIYNNLKNSIPPYE